MRQPVSGGYRVDGCPVVEPLTTNTRPSFRSSLRGASFLVRVGKRQSSTTRALVPTYGGTMTIPTTQVTGKPTTIPGLVVFEVTKVEDDRGWFQEKFHQEKLVAAGLPPDFSVVQTSVAFNMTGSTRGIHAEPWNKYVSIVTGSAFAAYVDLRPGVTFGRVHTVELTPTTAVFIPAGVGNSYQCLTDLHYLYSVDQHWSPAAYDSSEFVNLADPELGIVWPIPLDRAVISDRDRQHPPLNDLRLAAPQNEPPGH